MASTAEVHETTGLYLVRERRVATATSIGVPGTPITAVGLDKVERWVFEVRESADIYFLGNKLDEQPGLAEWAYELVKPGKQITTKRTGKRGFFLIYYGFLNIANAPLAKREQNIGWVTYFGSDPIKEFRLFGDSNAAYISSGGKNAPEALAYFDRTTGKKEYIAAQAKENIMKALSKPSQILKK